MKLHDSIIVNGHAYAKGDDVPWIAVYPLFLLHMLVFGGSGFAAAYGFSDVPVPFLYLQGGGAIWIYTLLYLVIFGRDDVKWMFINAALGVLGIVSQMDWILSLFGRHMGDFPPYVHVIPFLYFVLYTFLIRHAFLDLFGAREDETKRKRVEFGYVGATVATYLLTHFLES